MSFNYPAASSTIRHSLVGSVSIGATATTTLMMCWCRPTATTADVSVIGAGPTNGIATGTAGAESTITIYLDATTDAVWRTPAATMPLDTWVFIAALISMTNTGSAEAVRCWVGYQDTPPVEQSMTNVVASAGNWVGNTTMVVGNSTAGAFGFGGDIAMAYFLAQSAHDIKNPLPIATAGTITQAEANTVLARHVNPMYYGRPDVDLLNTSGNGTIQAVYFTQSPLNEVVRWIDGAVTTSPTVAATVAGAPTDVSVNPPKRLPDPHWLLRRGLYVPAIGV